MDFSGILHDIHLDYISHKPVISFLINQEPNGLDSLKDAVLSIKVGKQTRKRSLDANAYFHVLCDKLRQAHNVSMACMKNELISSYGQIDYLDDVPLVYKTNCPPERMKELLEVHTKYFKTGDDGAFWYMLYRGSHTYNTKEMSQLIEGTVYECKESGIETATPDELRKMNELWRVKNGE